MYLRIFLSQASQVTYRLKPSLIQWIMYQLLMALYYLHSAEIVHRDIRPTSILLGRLSNTLQLNVPDSSGHMKLGSFSEARSLYSQPFSRQLFSRYSAPENYYMLQDRPPHVWKAGDVWSAGLVFVEMLRLSPLFDAKDKYALLSQVRTATLLFS